MSRHLSRLSASLHGRGPGRRNRRGGPRYRGPDASLQVEASRAWRWWSSSCSARGWRSPRSAGRPAPPRDRTPPPTSAGVQHLHLEYGPLAIRPGQNLIDTNKYRIPQPTEDGWIVGFRPNLRLANGTVPPVDVLHLHHGVWANAQPARRDRRRCSPSASSPPARRRPRSSSPRATATRTARRRRVVPQLHDPQPHPEAVHRCRSPTTSTSCPRRRRRRAA